MELNFTLPNLISEYESIPKYLETMIDEALKRDFIKIKRVTPEDQQNDMYKAMKFSFDAGRVEVVFERKVYSSAEKSKYIPRVQFLFGFYPTDGLCIFTQKKSHKEMLCDGPIRELATKCPLTQSLQYILVPFDQFRVWSYIPVCCDEHETCAIKNRPLKLRRELFQD